MTHLVIACITLFSHTSSCCRVVHTVFACVNPYLIVSQALPRCRLRHTVFASLTPLSQVSSRIRMVAMLKYVALFCNASPRFCIAHPFYACIIPFWHAAPRFHVDHTVFACVALLAQASHCFRMRYTVVACVTPFCMRNPVFP